MIIAESLSRTTLAVALAVIVAIGVIVIAYVVYKCRRKTISTAKHQDDSVTLPSKLPVNEPSSNVPSNGIVYMVIWKSDRLYYASNINVLQVKSE